MSFPCDSQALHMQGVAALFSFQGLFCLEAQRKRLMQESAKECPLIYTSSRFLSISGAGSVGMVEPAALVELAQVRNC